VAAEPAEPPADRQAEERVAEPRGFDVGRGLPRQLGQERADRADQPVELRVALAVVRRSLVDPVYILSSSPHE